MLKLTDYTLNTDGADWSDLLSSWSWLIPREFTVWFANRFGDLFIVMEDGSVHMLDVGLGSLEKVADNRADFSEKIDEGNNANDWMMIPLVDKLVTTGVSLDPGECYSYLQLPILGGQYTVENTKAVSLARHYKAFGPIHDRIKDLPNGTKVRFEVTG